MKAFPQYAQTWSKSDILSYLISEIPTEFYLAASLPSLYFSGTLFLDAQSTQLFAPFFDPKVSESVVSTAEVLLIEGKRASKRASFANALSRRYTLTIAHTGKQALEVLEKSAPDIIVLNAATTRTSGHRICVTMHQFSTEIPIIHIQKQGSPRSKSPADILLNMPFTPRKLFNRIDRFIAAKDGEMLKTGPFQMNLKSRILTTKNGEQRLTPKLAKLMELFMRQPNEILERSYLMEHVWQTDYLGDTRTLDVHIRWIREAIEEKPSNPTFLQTIRGKGYILNLLPPKKKSKDK